MDKRNFKALPRKGNLPRESIAAVFVRHGDTSWNEGEGGEERVRGQSDVPLNQDGIEEAERIAQLVAKLRPTQILTSPLSRGRETARPIARRSGAGVTVTRDLLPWDKGNAEGKPIRAEDPKLRDYARNHPETPVPGGESYDAFKERFRSAAKSIADLGRKAGPVVAVTHSVDLRLLPHIFEGSALPDPLKGGLKPGEMVAVTKDNKVAPLPQPGRGNFRPRRTVQAPRARKYRRVK